MLAITIRMAINIQTENLTSTEKLLMCNIRHPARALAVSLLVLVQRPTSNRMNGPGQV